MTTRRLAVRAVVGAALLLVLSAVGSAKQGTRGGLDNALFQRRLGKFLQDPDSQAFLKKFPLSGKAALNPGDVTYDPAGNQVTWKVRQSRAALPEAQAKQYLRDVIYEAFVRQEAGINKQQFDKLRVSIAYPAEAEPKAVVKSEPIPMPVRPPVQTTPLVVPQCDYVIVEERGCCLGRLCGRLFGRCR
jgi:hypothetical protein